MAGRIDKAARSRIMSSIRSKNTKVEWLLRKALSKAGFRYRLHYPIVGKPDLVFSSKRVAVFIDGDFWHGHDWQRLKPKLKSRFWVQKIIRNMQRDREVTKELRKQGWKVVRMWEHAIRRNIMRCVRDIRLALGD